MRIKLHACTISNVCAGCLYQCWHVTHHCVCGLCAADCCCATTAVPLLSLDCSPRQFSLSVSELESHYKSLQKRLHPDRFLSAAHKHKHDMAVLLSSTVNQAYSTLRDAYPRALYMLQLEGHGIGEDTGTITDMQLLMDILEIREKIESEPDTAQLMQLCEQNEQNLRHTIQQLSAAFESQQWQICKQLTAKLSYLENIKTELSKRLPVQ